jgi:hypothetical protein
LFSGFEDRCKGYLSSSIGLPDNWREVARLLDLAAMVNFLDSEEETAKSFRTAVSVIEKTVASGQGSTGTGGHSG